MQSLYKNMKEKRDKENPQSRTLSWLIINKRTALGSGSKDRKKTGITTITERLNKEYELRK